MRRDQSATPEDTLSLKKHMRAKVATLAALPTWADEKLLIATGASLADWKRMLAVLGSQVDHDRLVALETFLRQWSAGGITKDKETSVPRVADEPRDVSEMDRLLSEAKKAVPPVVPVGPWVQVLPVYQALREKSFLPMQAVDWMIERKAIEPGRRMAARKGLSKLVKARGRASRP